MVEWASQGSTIIYLTVLQTAPEGVSVRRLADVLIMETPLGGAMLHLFVKPSPDVVFELAEQGTACVTASSVHGTHCL